MFPSPASLADVLQDALSSSAVAATTVAVEMASMVPPVATPAAAAVALSTAATSLATAVTSTVITTAAASDGGPGESSGECRLLGSFALLVQLALGGLALMSLVFKRWRERPQRPVKIWFFDASKQVFGSVLVHMANVFMSMLTSGRVSIKLVPTTVRVMARLMQRDEGDYSPNPCSFYLLNLAIDTTLGIPILIVLLRLTTAIIAYTPLGQPPESIRSGNYGNPPSAWWWLKQSVIYFCGLFGMKICVLIIFLILPWISRVGDWALKWTEGNEKLQIIFVMMLFPLIMNALQYYIIDSFIKNQQPADHMPLAFEDTDDQHTNSRSDHFDDRRVSGVSDILMSDEDQAGKRPGQAQEDEYDPDVDGDAPTVIGSSTSGRGRAPKAPIPKELYPHE